MISDALHHPVLSASLAECVRGEERRQFPARENPPCIGFSSTTVVSPVSRPGLFIPEFPVSNSDCRESDRFSNLADRGGSGAVVAPDLLFVATDTLGFDRASSAMPGLFFSRIPGVNANKAV